MSKSTISFPSAFVSLFLEYELLPLYDGAVAQLIAMPFHYLGFWRWINSAGTCTWCHRDLVREEALVCAFCFAYISDVPQQNNKKADFKATLQVILASLRMVTGTKQPVSIRHTIPSISGHGKEGRICHGPLPPLPWWTDTPDLIFSLLFSLEGTAGFSRAGTQWFETGIDQMSTPSCIV